MRTALACIAALAALAGCQSGSSKTVAAPPAPAEQPTPQASRPELQPSAPETGSQAGSLGSGAPVAAPPSAPGESTAASQSDIGSASATTPASDERNPESRGKVLTNEGAVEPKAQARPSPSQEPPSAYAPGAGGPQTVTGGSVGQSAVAEVDQGLHVDSGAPPPPSERQVVQRIRQAVVADDAISPQGRSVMIHADGGRIVLEGEVGSEREKLRIGETAIRESGGRPVANQIEVRAPGGSQAGSSPSPGAPGLGAPGPSAPPPGANP